MSQKLGFLKNLIKNKDCLKIWTFLFENFLYITENLFFFLSVFGNIYGSRRWFWMAEILECSKMLHPFCWSEHSLNVISPGSSHLPGLWSSRERHHEEAAPKPQNGQTGEREAHQHRLRTNRWAEGKWWEIKQGGWHDLENDWWRTGKFGVLCTAWMNEFWSSQNKLDPFNLYIRDFFHTFCSA